MEGLLALLALVFFVSLIVMPFLIYSVLNHVNTQVGAIAKELSALKKIVHTLATSKTLLPEDTQKTVQDGSVAKTGLTQQQEPTVPETSEQNAAAPIPKPIQATRDLQEALSAIAASQDSLPVTDNLKDAVIPNSSQTPPAADHIVKAPSAPLLAVDPNQPHSVSSLPTTDASATVKLPNQEGRIKADATPAEMATKKPVQQSTINKKATAQEDQTEYPALIQDILKFFKQMVSGGNQWVLLGVLILFIGIAFLAKNATFQILISPSIRLASSACLGTILLGLGWFLRKKRPEFAVVIQGGSIAILYLTVAAAVRLYDLLPPAIGFALLIVFTIFGTVLSVLQNAPVLAHISLAGGFISPIMVSTGSGNYIALFSFYIILNTSVLATTWFKSWKYLHLNAFIFTTGIAILWAYNNYEPGMYVSILPFMLFYFVFFSILPIIRSKDTETVSWLHPNIAILFYTPMLTLAFLLWLDPAHWTGAPLQLLAGIPYISLLLLLMGLIYIGISSILFKQQSAWKKLYCETFLALSILFLNLSPLMALIQLDMLNINQIIWGGCILAMEGTVLLWLGLRQDRLLLRAFGHIMLLLSAVGIIIQVCRLPLNVIIFGNLGLLPQAFLNINFLGTILASGIFLACSYIVHKYKEHIKHGKSLVQYTYVIILGLILTGGALKEVVLFTLNLLNQDTLFYISLGLLLGATIALPVICIFCGATLYLAHKHSWKAALGLQVVPYTVAMLCAIPIIFTAGTTHTYWFELSITPVSKLIALGLLAIPALEWALHWYKKSRWHDDNAFSKRAQKFQQIRLILLYSCIIPYISIGSSMLWSTSTFVYGSALILLLALWAAPACLYGLAWTKKQAEKFPSLQLSNGHWLLASAIPLFKSVHLLANLLFHSGKVSTGIYLPVLSPTDILMLLNIAAIFYWLKIFASMELPPSTTNIKPILAKIYMLTGWCQAYHIPQAVLLIMLFIAAHSIIARTIYTFYPGLEWYSVVKSYPYRAAISVFWALSGLGAMITGNRLGLRWVWKAGAALLLLDAVKLLLIDRQMTEDLLIILSFILVGIILIATTYFAPIPPKITQKKANESAPTKNKDGLA